MPNTDLTQERIAVATDYFRKIDSGDPTILDILTDDVVTYFPKFGVGYGKAEFMEVAKGLLGVVCGRGRNPTLRLWPAIFSGEIDVFPSERRNMGQEIGR